MKRPRSLVVIVVILALDLIVVAWLAATLAPQMTQPPDPHGGLANLDFRPYAIAFEVMLGVFGVLLVVAGVHLWRLSRFGFWLAFSLQIVVLAGSVLATVAGIPTAIGAIAVLVLLFRPSTQSAFRRTSAAHG